MYKIGTKVSFTFLGEVKKGEIISKHDNGTFKIMSVGGTTYPGIHKKKTDPNNKVKTKQQILGYIINKL